MPRVRPSLWLAGAQAAAAAALVPLCAQFLPPPWSLPPAAALVRAAAWAACGAGAYFTLRGDGRQSDEDLACHTAILGLPGSGKTRFAYGLIRQWQGRGHGGVWLSSKGGRNLLPYMTPEAAPLVVFINPTSRRPRGINLLRTYGGGPAERERIAGHVVSLFGRLYPNLSENMGELLRMGALALLQFASAAQVRVSLPHLYLFFWSDTFRARVLCECKNPVIGHAFTGEEMEARTVAAVRRQLRRAVASDALLATLGQPDGVDMRQLIDSRGAWLVTDFDEGKLGPEVADYLSQVVASAIEVLTPGRRRGAGLVHVVADEIERYQSESIVRGIEVAREFRVAWTLVNQAGRQLRDDTMLAADMCGSKYYFQLTTDDAARAHKVVGDQVDLTRLPARRYVARIRAGGWPRLVEGRTPDVAPSDQVADSILDWNARGPTKQQIIEPIYKLLAGTPGAVTAPAPALWQ